MVFFLIVAN